VKVARILSLEVQQEILLGLVDTKHNPVAFNNAVSYQPYIHFMFCSRQSSWGKQKNVGWRLATSSKSLARCCGFLATAIHLAHRETLKAKA
jgi:hypothetical protein